MKLEANLEVDHLKADKLKLEVDLEVETLEAHILKFLDAF